jgi:hypothetical protein
MSDPVGEQHQAVADAGVRIAADFGRTTGRALQLRLRLDSDGVVPVVEVVVDGQSKGWFGQIPAAVSLEDLVVELADRACEHSLHEVIWGGWPICERHNTHPLTPSKREHVAVWVCPADDLIVARIGELTTGLAG